MSEPNILPPHGSDLYPTPDEREKIEPIMQDFGPWETYDSEASAPILKAFRAGYALREDELRAAYDRGYAAAETEMPCCCDEH